MKTLVFGEIIWDVYPNERTIGGAAFNFAANLGLLGNETYLLSAIGGDELGREAISFAKKYNIKTDFIQENTFGTGRCIVTLDNGGLPSFNVLQNTSYDNITADDVLLKKISVIKPDALYFGTLAQRGNSVSALKKILNSYRFTEIFCDINIRNGCSSPETTDTCLRNATILKLSDEEAHFLVDYKLIPDGTDDISIRISEAYPNIKHVLYTMGGKGSRVYETFGKVFYESGLPPKTAVVSTVGAGDCYGATYFHCIKSGMTIRESIAAAAEKSRIVVSQKEAIPYPCQPVGSDFYIV